jgi:hypothetical protein
MRVGDRGTNAGAATATDGPCTGATVAAAADSGESTAVPLAEEPEPELCTESLLAVDEDVRSACGLDNPAADKEAVACDDGPCACA